MTGGGMSGGDTTGGDTTGGSMSGGGMDRGSTTGDHVAIRLEVNGQAHDIDVDPCRTLAEVLREELHLTGTHLACEHGVCGACTVALDGAAVRSCLQLAVQADGCRIETVEGLAPEGQFHPIQEAMWNAHAFQCAFCAPGFIMTLYCLLNSGGEPPDRERLREELSGNLCRCTGYGSILAGAEAAADAMRPDAMRPTP